MANVAVEEALEAKQSGYFEFQHHLNKMWKHGDQLSTSGTRWKPY